MLKLKDILLHSRDIYCQRMKVAFIAGIILLFPFAYTNYCMSAKEVTLKAKCALPEGWMADGWGKCLFTFKNESQSVGKIVRWSACWQANGEAIGTPWGDKLDLELPAAGQVTREECCHLSTKTIEKSKPNNPLISGTFTIEMDGKDIELPYQIEVPEATLPEKLKLVKGKYVGIELMESRFDNFPAQDNVIRWLNQSYEAMMDLTGYVPYEGKLIVIKECPRHPWALYAGNPVVMNTQYVKETIDDINDGNIPFGWVHEIGHDFDVYGEWYIWNGPSCEWQANYKLAYAFETIPDRSFKVKWTGFSKAAYMPTGGSVVTDGKQFVECFYVFFGDPYLADPERKWDSLSSDELHSFFQRIQRIYGWGPYKQWYRTYKRFDQLGLDKPKTPEEKIQLIAAILSHTTETDLVPIFQRWRMPVTQEDVEAMIKKYPIKVK